jgi:SAM-dependent methyltransferase
MPRYKSGMEGTRPAARADLTFSDRAGAAWTRLQAETDAQIEPLGRAALARLAPSAGERLLDVGCGCGQTLLQLAALVGPSGAVVGVDVSAPMLAAARARVAGRPAIALVRADAQRHPFAPASFDALYSRLGVMFFADARAAFANLRPSLRAGGRLAFVCWQALARNPFANVPLQAVMRLLPPSAYPDMLEPDRPGPFSLADADRLRAILADAGFVDVTIEPWEQPVHLGGAMTLAEALAYSRQIGPAARAMAEAPDALRPALEAALAESLAPFVSARGVWMDAAALIVSGRA